MDVTNCCQRFAIGLLMCASLRGDTLTATLTSLELTGYADSALTFVGTIQNNSGAELFLNGAGGNLTYSELTLDVSPFFVFSPLSLRDGESFNGPLFAVAISNVALPGDYPGMFTIQGGVDSSTFDTVATADFQVHVSSLAAVPEPPLMCVVGMMVLMIVLTHYYFRE